MTLFKRSQVISLCESASNTLKSRAVNLPEAEMGLWGMAQVFIASTIKGSVIDGIQCEDELNALGSLSSDEMLDVYKLLAFWFFLLHNATDKAEVRKVLITVYNYTEADIDEMSDEYLNKADAFGNLRKLLSSAIGCEVSQLTFMPHVLSAFKVATSLGK